MTDKIRKLGRVAMVLAPMTLAAAAPAQTVPTPQETPRTIPGLVITTPTPAASQTPVPVPTDTVRGLALPTATATPRAVATPRSHPVREPTPVRTRAVEAQVGEPGPSPSATPTVQTAPPPQTAAEVAPKPAVVPTPVASTAPALAPAAGGSDSWPWIAAAIVAALAVAGWWVIRGRSARASVERAVQPASPPVVAPPAPVVPIAPSVAAPATSQAALSIALQPGRAGLNMLSAVVEAHVVVANRGDGVANDVRVFPTLLSAHSGQDADLAAAFAAPASRAANPPFALSPGEERRVRIVAVLPRDALRSMEAGGRPMFVPLLAVDIRYATETGAPAQAGQAFIIGIERVDSAKLAPFWLDAPLRMHDQIAARAQGAAVGNGVG